MSVNVEIPTPLRRFTGDAADVPVDGDSVSAALADLVRRHPSLGRHLFSDAGELRSFVNVFVNGENVRHGKAGATPLADGDTVSIIPSIAGGSTAGGSETQEGGTP